MTATRTKSYRTNVPAAATFQKTILRWYDRSKRRFPWRRTRDPYRVLVSEVMLQQTQVARVALKYPDFLRRYPTLRALASALKADVLRSWSGMGYNNRAVRLHATVNEVAARYDGKIPSDPAELEQLPGIGKYTAHAVAGFAYGKRVPLVDVNIRRVLSRVTVRLDRHDAILPERHAWKVAAEILPRAAYDWNQALMDFGSQICRARNPRCAECPVRKQCASAASLAQAGSSATAGSSSTASASRNRPSGATRSKPEPSYAGVPLRIWRGRIVEALRKRIGHTPVAEIASSIGIPTRRAVPRCRAVSARQTVPRVILRLVNALEKDGVVSLRRGRNPALSLAS